jgi:hypothetical protein
MAMSPSLVADQEFFSIEAKVRDGRCYKIADDAYSLTASNHYRPSDFSLRPPEFSVNDILSGLKDKSRVALATDQFLIIRCDEHTNLP